LIVLSQEEEGLILLVGDGHKVDAVVVHKSIIASLVCNPKVQTSKTVSTDITQTAHEASSFADAWSVLWLVLF